MKNATKFLMLGVLAAGTLAAGCQSTPSATLPANQVITSAALQSYNWQLVDAKRSNGSKVTPLFFDTANPLILEFVTESGNNFVSLLNTCNNMGAGYSIVNGEVQLSGIRSTRMACPTPQANFDTAAAAAVQGKYSLTKAANQSPILTITNADQVATFKAIAK